MPNIDSRFSGTHNPDRIRALQAALSFCLGIDGRGQSVDASFDTLTQERLELFQATCRLPVTGAIDGLTAQKLLALTCVQMMRNEERHSRVDVDSSSFLENAAAIGVSLPATDNGSPSCRYVRT